VKRVIKASATAVEYGTWLLDRDGHMEPTLMHVPSTTYLGRGLKHLAPTDAEFLYKHGKITAEEAECIIKVCLVEFLTVEKNLDQDDRVGMTDMAMFNDYAELRYCSSFRSKFMMMITTVGQITTDADDREFAELNKKWYPWLQNNFVKVSRFGDVVEFRISSEDGFDWNKVIIDYGILKSGFGDDPDIRYNILRESSEGYKSYFIDATLNDILSQDKMVLSSKQLRRKVVGAALEYYEVVDLN